MRHVWIHPGCLARLFYGCKMIGRTFCFATLFVMRSLSQNGPFVVGDSGVEVMPLGSLPLTISQVDEQIYICLSWCDFHPYQGI